MRGIKLLTTLLTALLGCCLTVHADPPTVIRVIRNAVRSGSQGYAEARDAITVLGAASVTGPSESWSFEMLDSFASLEDLDRTLPMSSSGPTLTPTMCFHRRQNLHRAVSPQFEPPLGRSREDHSEGALFPGFGLSNPARRPDRLRRLTRLRTSRFESINFDQPEIAYQIMSGNAVRNFPVHHSAGFARRLLTMGWPKRPRAARDRRGTKISGGSGNRPRNFPVSDRP